MAWSCDKVLVKPKIKSQNLESAHKNKCSFI